MCRFRFLKVAVMTLTVLVSSGIAVAATSSPGAAARNQSGKISDRLPRGGGPFPGAPRGLGRIVFTPMPSVSVPKPIPSAVASRLTIIAEKFAALTCDSHPKSISAVATTRGKALTVATPGDFIYQGNSEPVYLILMEGSFTDFRYTGPPGSTPPKGHYLGLVVDRVKFQILDYGLGPKPPPVSISSLGEVTKLLGRPTSTPTYCHGG